MNYDPKKHHRSSIRLQGYDYRQAGFYYVTICCYQRQCLFGEIVNGVMQPNLMGETVVAVWNRLTQHFPFIELDAFVLMPNHVHGIIVIQERQINLGVEESQVNNASLPRGTQSGSLGAIIQNFKSVSKRRINRFAQNKLTIWQRGYHEEIIRNEKAYENIRKYILENPLKWEEDAENPVKTSKTK